MQRLSSHDLAWSTDWGAVFGVQRPLIVEIGFGRGAFLVHLARTYPDHNIIGFEISSRCLDTTERLIEREQLTNVRPVYSMAATALAHLFEPETIEQIHLNFPDPWFKTRHSERRIMRRDRLDWMVSRLKPGGLWYLATDVPEYAAMTADLLAQTPALDNLLPAPYVHEMPGRTVTKYEAEARRAGRICYYFAYRRNLAPVPYLPAIKDLEMPHVVYTSPLSLDATADAFPTRIEGHLHEGDLHIHLIACYRELDPLLIETAVSEATIDQHVAIQILNHRRGGSDGEYTIQLNPLGHPRPTVGVHRAVRMLTDRVLALHPESRILNQKLREE